MRTILHKDRIFLRLSLLLLAAYLLSACQPQAASADDQSSNQQNPTPTSLSSVSEGESATITPFPERPNYAPGELVDYTVQTGDTLPALAARFNTSVDEIRENNLIIPEDVTTLPPGMPMQIPIYFVPFWGSPDQILPDSLFVNGPAQQDFDTQTYLDNSSGWLRYYRDYAAGAARSGAGIVDLVATNFSLSPQLLLALLDYQLGAVSQPVPPEDLDQYPLGYHDQGHRGFYLQLIWAADRLNQGYYGWRTGNLTVINHNDGTIERPDPWQTAASAALMYYFSLEQPKDIYNHAIGPDGFAKTYSALFGDPWENDQAHIPGSLQQPEMLLPFESGKSWAYTGGPHTGWGSGEPWAALDFAPPSTLSGCISSPEWTTAPAAGVVARTGDGILELDLDGDGDIRTGWTVFYLHIASKDRTPLGTQVQAGDPLGHPSCEGGRTTGTHIHIARKYNGEWIPADGPLAFNLEGWIAHNGTLPYLGTLTRFSQTVTACECSNQTSLVTAEEQ
ncbi:MAG: LysM peptidoglycan-binding domain-containing protein [Anaerolineales bacterium]